MRKFVVLGAGESGVGAALLAQKMNYEVFVSDSSKVADKYRLELEKAAIEYEEGMHSMERIKQADVLVKSPGIPDHIDLIKELVKSGQDPISEIEFASRFCNSKIIAITGSNGKTTTTGLIAHLIFGSDLTVKVGGNYGTSFARLLLEDEDPDVFVLEISSFQLDGIRKFKPDVAILLNITPDHLDRYDYKMELYARSKMRIAMNLEESNLLILNHSDKWSSKLWHEKLQEKKITQVNTVFVHMNREFRSSMDQTYNYQYDNISLNGPHNDFNAQCAVWSAEYIGVTKEHIEKQLASFVNLPHRMEWVGDLAKVRFVNDSKATNVDAVTYALKSCDRPVVWIAGGEDKGNDYSLLLPLVKTKVIALVCLGLDNKKIRSTFEDIVPQIVETKDINEAVEMAYGLAQNTSHTYVLLSPACASFDLFENYEARGDLFREAVKRLEERGGIK